MMGKQNLRIFTRLLNPTPAKSALQQRGLQRNLLMVGKEGLAATGLYQTQYRHIFLHWVNSVFNKVSEDRIKEVGPDRACAEWLLRNGALVQWVGSKNFVTDYNALPLSSSEKGHYYIKTVDATDSSVMAIGFPHFEGCKHIEEITLKNCKYLDDEALPMLSVLKNSLKTLEIVYCWNLTGTGLSSLSSLSNLKTLKLEGLPEVKDKAAIETKLRAALPDCDITFNQKN